ncbi:hypothetical protein CHH83_01680 [Bacillus sp. 7586-K]|nr:hypothetical protein CHH83_01680 [Bacillus sp. 7586-K]
MMKLYTYQKELLNSKGNKIIINWCRGAGKDTALAYYIVEKKPSKVLLAGDRCDYRSLKEHLDLLKDEYDYVIEVTNLEDFKIIFNKTGQQLIVSIENFPKDNVKYDLIISKDCYFYQFKKENFETLISSFTKNIYKIDLSKYQDFKIINVDHKILVKENPKSIDAILESALTNGQEFYREYAILDKPKKEYISNDEFRHKALQSLQKQFLSIGETKDTVLTRKNIIEMIKDLHEMK